MPKLGIARDQERGDDCLGGGADHVAGDHHLLARQPIRPHAARQREDDPRQGKGGEDEAQVAGRSGQLEHGEGERHPHQRIADRRSGLPDPEQAEVALGERIGGAAQEAAEPLHGFRA